MNEANPTTISPIEPIHGDVVWHGRDMAQRTDWIGHHLERTEIGELETAIARIRAQGTEIIDVSKDDLPAQSHLGKTTPDADSNPAGVEAS